MNMNSPEQHVRYEYRMIALQNLSEDAFFLSETYEAGTRATKVLDELANDMASEGWEFYRLDTFSTLQKGCRRTLTGGMFGPYRGSISNYVATFRRPRPKLLPSGGGQ